MLKTRFTELMSCQLPIQMAAIGSLARPALAAAVAEALEAMPHWAGESVQSVKKIQPAPAIINELVSEA